MDLVGTLATVVAGVTSVAAVVVAMHAVRLTRNSALGTQLLAAYSDMLSALAQISSCASRMESSEIRQSRKLLEEDFQQFRQAATRVEILEPLLVNYVAFGEWIRVIANNLAANLRQADEWERNDFTADTLARFRPASVSDPQWAEAIRSRSYQSVLLVEFDIPKKRPKDFGPLEPWWRNRVLGYGDGSDWMDRHSVYSPHASYMVQSSRLLDDFVAGYVVPWMREAVKASIR